MENHIKVNISINKQSVGPINHLNLVQRYDWHHSFELDVPLEAFGGNDKYKTAKGYIGKAISIEFKAETASSSSSGGSSVTQANYRSGSMLFKGMVTTITLSKSKGNAASVLIKGYSTTILMEDGLASKANNKKSLSSILNDVLSNYSPTLAANVSASPDPQLGYCVQYNETNYNFISRMTAGYGQWCFYDGQQLNIGKLPSPGTPFKLTFGIDLETYNFDLKLVPLKFNARTYDYTNNNPLQVSSSSVDIGGLKNDPDASSQNKESDNFFKNASTFHPQEFIQSQSDLQNIMQYKKAGLAGGMVLLSGTSNDFRLIIGSGIKIDTNTGDKTSAISDEFIIINVTHFVDSIGNYHNNFEAVPKEIEFPPAHKNYTNPLCETQPAKVVKNADSASMNRVKVQFYWQDSGEATPWIRMISPYTGKQKGIQFIPEVGDEVLVAFENHNPNFPYVIGSLHHSNAKQDDRQDSNNYIKTIRTVSGNEIYFNDQSGKETISIYDKNKNNEVTLTLDNNGKITIASQNLIAISGKDITVDAQNSIKMTADTIQLSGKSGIKMQTQQTYEVDAMDYKVSANASVDIEAQTTAQLKAGAGATVDGGPQTAIKSSAMMDINGGGMTTIKGGMVMIN